MSEYELSARSIRLPFPPSINSAFAQTAFYSPAAKRTQLRRHMSKEYRAWRDEAVVRLLSLKVPRYDVPVYVDLILTPPTGVERDADNYFKAVNDALVKARILRDDGKSWVRGVGALWVDDHLISRANAHVLILLEPVDNVRPAMRANERNALRLIRKTGVLLVGPSHKVTAAQQGLIAKGYIIPQQGLLDGQPQGYVIA